MDSLLLTSLFRLLRVFAPPHTQRPPPKPTAPKTYQQLLTDALSPTHALQLRHELPANLIASLLTPHTQLVNLSPGAIPLPTHAPAYTVDDLTRTPNVTIPITAALNGCVWDSYLVQTGFDWTVRSVWFIPLDVSLLAYDLLDRHFRMVATLSTPDSRAVVLYPSREIHVAGCLLKAPFEQIEPFMKLCGFAVESVSTLAQLADQRLLDYEEYMNVMRVAVIRPVPRSPSPVVDAMSIVTYASIDRSSRTTSTEFEAYLSSDTKVVRFELDISTLPPHLAVQQNQVVVIGSESCVGCWEPRHAKRMTGRIDVPGVLVADVSVSVFANDVEYKYAVVRGDDVVEWEDGWNRRFKGDDGIVKDEWRC